MPTTNDTVTAETETMTDDMFADMFETAPKSAAEVVEADRATRAFVKASRRSLKAGQHRGAGVKAR